MPNSEPTVEPSMIENLAWLALEVKYLDRATAFYGKFEAKAPPVP